MKPEEKAAFLKEEEKHLHHEEHLANTIAHDSPKIHIA
jgi:hypothetical protein